VAGIIAESIEYFVSLTRLTREAIEIAKRKRMDRLNVFTINASNANPYLG